MSQLTWSSIPGATDISDAAISADQPLTDADMLAISHNAKFGVVRQERFQGYYKDGETVGLPTSPVDGYTYTRQELRYEWSFYSPLGTTAACNGTPNPPTLDGSMQVGGGALDGLEYFIAYIEHKAQANPGKVHVQSMVNDGTTQTLLTQGVLYVTTIAERLGG